MNAAEVELALEVVRMSRGVMSYMRNRNVSMEAFAERIRQADAEGREFDLDDLQALVDARHEAKAALDAEIARRRG